MANRNRCLHVAAVSQDGLAGRETEQLVEQTLKRLEWAACRRPDIVCLSENWPAYDKDTAPDLPCPLTERLAEWARRQNCYVLSAMRIRDGDGQFNSCAVIGRDGQLVGRYDKIHPVDTEISARGISPGALDPPVFKTDFGTIGIQICFDVNWPGTWRRLKEKGAQVVFFPSAFPAHRHLSALARMNEYYVVSAARSRASRIYDVTGDVIASSGIFQPWVDATLCLGKRVFEIDHHVGKMREVERKYGRRICVQWYHDEDQFTLASLDPELAVEDIIEAFGLTPLRDYIARCEGVQDAARDRAPGGRSVP